MAQFEFNLETVRHFMVDSNPWARLAGIVVDEVAHAHIRLHMPPSKNIENPFGAYHAGALYTFGETSAAGLALVSFDLSGGGRQVLMKAGEITYDRIVRENLVVDARLDDETIARVDQGVSQNGKHNEPVTIEMKHEAGDIMCVATYTVHVRKS